MLEIIKYICSCRCVSPCRRSFSDVFVVLVLIAITLFSTYSYYVYIFPCTLQVIGNALAHPFSHVDSTAPIFAACPTLIPKEATSVMTRENTSLQMFATSFNSVSDAEQDDVISNLLSYHESKTIHNKNTGNMNFSIHEEHGWYSALVGKEVMNKEREGEGGGGSRSEVENRMYIQLLTRVSAWSYILLIISTVLLIMWYWSYLEAVMTAPGDVPSVFAQRGENSSSLALLTFYEPLPFYTPIALLRRAYRHRQRRHHQRRIKQYVNNNNYSSGENNLSTSTHLKKKSSPREDEVNAKWHTKYKMIACSGDSENDADEQEQQQEQEHNHLHKEDVKPQERENNTELDQSHQAITMPLCVEHDAAGNAHIGVSDAKAMITPVMHVTSMTGDGAVHTVSELDCNKKNDKADVPLSDNINKIQNANFTRNLSKRIGAYPPLPRQMRPTKIRSFPTHSSLTLDTNSSRGEIAETKRMVEDNRDENACREEERSEIIKSSAKDFDQEKTKESVWQRKESDECIGDESNNMQMKDVQLNRPKYITSTNKESNSQHDNESATDNEHLRNAYTVINNTATAAADDDDDQNNLNANPNHHLLHQHNNSKKRNVEEKQLNEQHLLHSTQNRCKNMPHHFSKTKEQFFFNPYANSYTSVLNNYLNLCPVCATYKPPRAHHCSRCNRCILRYDHHCPWIGQCVGFFNLKNYLLLLFYSSLAGMWIMLQLTIAFAAYFLKLQNFSARALVNTYTGANENVSLSTNELLTPSHLHSSQHGLTYRAMRNFDLLVDELNVGPPTIGVFICYGECLAFTIMCTYLLLRYIFYVRHNIATIDVVIHESTLAFSHHNKNIESEMSTEDDIINNNNNINSSSNTSYSDDDFDKSNTDKLNASSFSSSSSLESSTLSSSMELSPHAERHRSYHSHHVTINTEPKKQKTEMTASRKFIAFLSSRGCTVDDERRFGAKNMKQFMKRNVYDVGVKRNLLQVFGDGVYVDERENNLTFHENNNAEVNDHTIEYEGAHNDAELQSQRNYLGSDSDRQEHFGHVEHNIVESESNIDCHTHFFRDKMEGNQCIHRNFCIRWLYRLTPFPAYPRQLHWPSAQLRSGPFTHIAAINTVNHDLHRKRRWEWPFSAHRNDSINKSSNINTIDKCNRLVNEQTMLHDGDKSSVRGGHNREYGATLDNRANRLSYPHAIQNYNLLIQLNIDEQHLLGLRFPTRRSLGLEYELEHEHKE